MMSSSTVTRSSTSPDPLVRATMPRLPNLNQCQTHKKGLESGVWVSVVNNAK